MTVATEVKFNFKSRSVKDDEGKVLKTLPKQPSIVTALPYLTADEIVAILSDTAEENAKVRALVVDAVNEEVKAAAKSQFDEVLEENQENEAFVINASYLDHDKLTLAFIASIPPAQRGARAISEEELKAFFTDYKSVMLRATGKDEKKIDYHLAFLQKPQKLKSQPDALKIMIEQLDIYLSSSEQLEETGTVATRIRTRFQKWLEADSAVDFSAF